MENQETKSNQDRNQWGGPRPGGGRPKGSRNTIGRVVLPKAVREAAIAGAEAVILSEDLTPLDIMQRVMHGDPTVTREMYEAARDLAPYRHPKLSAVAVKEMPSVSSPDDARRKIAELLTRGRAHALITG
jgi:hypothetical protein